MTFGRCSFVLMLALVTAGCEQIDQAHRDLLGPESPFKDPPAVRTPRPAHWAQPVNRPNTDWVFFVDTEVYRGPHPTPQMLASLPEVKTVVNLRLFHPSDEIAEDAELSYREIPIEFWELTDEPIYEFLRLATDERYTPLYVHCNLGSDRTGAAVAMYRMVVQGWTADEAIAEMTENGHGFNHIWDNIIAYLRKVDVKAMRERVKSAPPLPPPATDRP